MADTVFAPAVDEVYAHPSRAGFTDAWLGTLAFSGQIFFDFAAYSSCAIGAAMCLGFMLPDNFRSPYAAIGFSDFWKRWHISLSSWLRDYLYIPLGGNRKGPMRTYINLLVTMLLGGLWHGASWNFVVWGGLHALYLTCERPVRRRWGGRPWASNWLLLAFLGLLTYSLVCGAWVFFRAQDLPSAWMLVQAMFDSGKGSSLISTQRALAVLGCLSATIAGQWFMRDRRLDEIWVRLPWWLRSLAISFLLLGILLAPRSDRAFIYFQF